MVIGVGFFIWNVIAGVHDLYISSKAKECATSVVGEKVFDWVDEKHGPDRWDSSLETYIESLDHPAKRYEVKNAIEKKCSELLRIEFYNISDRVEVGAYTKNYMDGYPAVAKERFLYMALSLGIAVCLMTILFGIMKWLVWLGKD